ncbi:MULTISPECIES: aldo/keto reductase [Dictyoglomus]|jgi:L-glyceraldehyde 3-phosphate reductase|uniref:Aldo/keto reductase n=1 Tax=Dictyoglomus turgidum (strain DSM 6724 / Z-1310) TaxID=515635 RepID=B8DZB1_DICTD|nr:MULTISPECIES: aldo/keto reductase [Dictyoglomus]ACK41844.1 aldo/keto reductase [Dictyoglomus turgidum DSM 6724]PNV79719.1 MAG: L-glyceraldehyde 3-phosphate reductase [Dictyoglomus turgidum]HBU31301.1 L-glyceraldehyde 3-phosphate reductase [Dictyoglomus sp.]
MIYVADSKRYEVMIYRRCGKSGLKLPAISLGFWHNFGYNDSFENMRNMVRKAFDLGITHFDLANNYGPPPGSAEENFGRILKFDLKPYRDEIVISTKAGYKMWDGPYGDFGSKKYLIASLEQSLKRMGLDYVDIFYHHRPDPETPIEETMEALYQIVRQGKALYVGISNYGPEETKLAYETLSKMGVRLIVNQILYNMFFRKPEEKLFGVMEELGIGATIFSPLAQGLLTEKYLNGIPEDSRVKRSGIFLKESDITPEKIEKVRKLSQIAKERGQSVAQLAISWILRNNVVSSVIIGASKPEQIEENVKAISILKFSEEELKRIDEILE